MQVLVAFASRHGSTRGIALRIGERLRAAGLEVTVVPAGEAPPPVAFDAAVIGSAVYYGSWLEAAGDYVRRHAAALALRPVWLFSSGPVSGHPTTEAKEVAEFGELVQPRGQCTFAGAIHRDDLSLVERAVSRMVGADSGDFRDWPEIDAWADEIAASLRAAAPRVTRSR